ncbi:MAG: hypothetical protein AUK26_00960 [Syntrophaceae bacterium CG2_30_58_14]|nr:MAG: hypothetical protein AUK26_00960 [Syntrophaceae bacterium CG2_30_58_14]
MVTGDCVPAADGKMDGDGVSALPAGGVIGLRLPTPGAGALPAGIPVTPLAGVTAWGTPAAPPGVAGETARCAAGVWDDAAGFPATVAAGGGVSVFTWTPFGSGAFDAAAGAVVTGCSSPARRAARPVPGDRKINIAKKTKKVANTS